MSQLIGLLLVATLTASPVEAATRARFLMGTVCEISIDSSAADGTAADRAFAEVDRIERRISTWREESELSRLDVSSTMPTRVSPELFSLLRDVVAWSRETGGAFNPLVGSLVSAWKTREDGAVPDETAIAKALERSGLENVDLDAATRSVTLRRGARIEEGGFGKGYAIDRAMSILAADGVTDATINFGGQVAVLGTAEVAIADPENRERPAITVTIANASISTSSGSERTFVVDGRRFSHIVDPRSGRALPPRGSVSVIHSSALVADILSTALYVMGPDEGRRWAESHRVTAIFIAPGGDGHYTVSLPEGTNPSSLRLRVADDHFKLKGKRQP